MYVEQIKACIQEHVNKGHVTLITPMHDEKELHSLTERPVGRISTIKKVHTWKVLDFLDSTLKGYRAALNGDKGNRLKSIARLSCCVESCYRLKCWKI